MTRVKNTTCMMSYEYYQFTSNTRPRHPFTCKFSLMRTVTDPVNKNAFNLTITSQLLVIIIDIRYKNT